MTATVTWSDLAALAHPPRLRNLPTSTPALAIFIANAPVIEETRASMAHAILGNAPSTARGLGSGAYHSRTPSERGGLAGRCDKSGTSLPKKKKRSEVSAVRHMIHNVMSGFQKSLEDFGENTSNSSSAGASSRGTLSPRGERPAKNVSSARQSGASSSRARASSCHEEREERARRSMRRPDRSTGDCGPITHQKEKAQPFSFCHFSFWE